MSGGRRIGDRPIALLIVDDHPVVRAGLAALLRERAGAGTVLEAAGAGTGLALAQAHGDLDAVLLDRKRSVAALLPLERADVLGRPWSGVFELSLWMTLRTTRRVSSGGSSC